MDTTMDTPNQITFYDIASGPPVHPYAPNPWKARYALNYTHVSYTTQWVELPDVTATRKSLNLKACRRHADDTDFYTLPVIHDHSSDTLVGDSFDIALHLDTKSDRPLFRPGTTALHRGFNAYADSLFTSFVPLAAYYLPFNPDSAHISKAEFCRRAGRELSEFEIKGKARQDMLKAFEEGLVPLTAWFVKRDEGPFLEGREVMYADFIIGGWLQFFRNTLPEWSDLKSWHDGLFGKLFDALEEWADVQ
ncbi:hypothetical protein K461DRAFT_291389 [Myriangium duriaei CBS 260.36]|uniref:GST N-terminal domain-containing protein n=1 Tax=Myriangium duriaei CBS 260.36 TaxID=1168546 RepID=A0A9P4JBA1_9PEZI|nr:hypothetical protein K461DRAFT_291389 [Myriangium duriaei CBS 260.36]